MMNKDCQTKEGDSEDKIISLECSGDEDGAKTITY